MFLPIFLYKNGGKRCLIIWDDPYLRKRLGATSRQRPQRAAAGDCCGRRADVGWLVCPMCHSRRKHQGSGTRRSRLGGLQQNNRSIPYLESALSTTPETKKQIMTTFNENLHNANGNCNGNGLNSRLRAIAIVSLALIVSWFAICATTRFSSPARGVPTIIFHNPGKNALTSKPAPPPP